MRCEICKEQREDDNLMLEDMHVCKECYDNAVEGQE